MSDIDEDNEENQLRRKLDILGFGQPLPSGAVALVSAILEDLITTTESLKKSKEEIQRLRELKEAWDLGVEPYKCDNSRLLAENNSLHIKLLKQKDLIEISNIESARTIRNLEEDKRLLEDHCVELSNRIRELEIKYNDMGKVKLKSQKRKPFISTVKCGEILPKDDDKKDFIKTAQSIKSNCKCDNSNYQYDMNKLQGIVKDQSSIIEALKRQNEAKDREIQRLNELLQGGRPPQTLARDCCYRNVGALSDDVEFLQKQKTSIQIELDECIRAKHEAMQRSLSLSQKNSELKSELKELEKAACDLERRANESMHEKDKQIDNLRRRLDESRDNVIQLEKENRNLKQNYSTNIDEYEKINSKLELKRLSEEKDYLKEKIKNLSQKEQEYQIEIDKLSKTNIKLKNQITLLKERMPLHLLDDNKSKESSIKSNSNDLATSKQNGDECNRLKSERDYFQKEYLKIIEKQTSCESYDRLKKELNDKDREITILKQELDLLRSRPDDLYSNRSVQSTLNRLEREFSVSKDEVRRLQIERNALRTKLKSATDSQLQEQRRTDELIQNLNNKIFQLEQEKNEISSAKVPTEAAINILGEEIEDLKTKLEKSRIEISKWKNQYNQIKMLQEQNEKSLINHQQKYFQIENEKGEIEMKLNKIDTSREKAQREIGTLRGELTILKTSNATLEREKDNLMIQLDNKTEMVYQLEREIKQLQDIKMDLTKELDRLRSKYNEKSLESQKRDDTLRETASETNTLRKQMSTLKISKDNIMMENSRLLSELSDVKSELRINERKLKESQNEVDTLKRQLQDYVKEVQRVEDLLMKNDREREEMLEHYRSLSRDATELEGNNHNLEVKAAETKKLLIEAESRVTDLEMQITLRDNDIKGLEKQITDLSSQVAKLEIDLEHQIDENRILKQDLEATKDLCNKLDYQKDKLNDELNEHSTIRQQLQRENERLKNELAVCSTGDRTASDNLSERLISSKQQITQYEINTKSLNKEVIKLQDRIKELEFKLEEECKNSLRNEALAHEYSVQLQELRNQLTNERFEAFQAHENFDSLNLDVQRNINKENFSMIPSININENNFIDLSKHLESNVINSIGDFSEDSLQINKNQPVMQSTHINNQCYDDCEDDNNDDMKSIMTDSFDSADSKLVFHNFDTSFLPPPPKFIYKNVKGIKNKLILNITTTGCGHQDISTDLIIKNINSK